MGLCKTPTFSCWRSMQMCQGYHCEPRCVQYLFLAPLTFAQHCIDINLKSVLEMVASLSEKVEQLLLFLLSWKHILNDEHIT